MAVTKTHPIKSTLKLALSYIMNPHKTDGNMLVSSFACSPETADIEFEMTRKRAMSVRGNVLARHLIQAFEPGEVTPEIAHEIGVKFATQVLQDKYEYVIATHIDKGHIHNHIIFNAVSFVNFKKYRSNKRSYYQIRNISDKLCKEYGLSIVVPTGNGKRYHKYKNISLIIDIKNCINAQESKGYEHWAKLFNLKQAFETLNFLTEHKIEKYDDLSKKHKDIFDKAEDIKIHLKDTENQMKYLAECIKNIQNYTNLKSIYEEYKKAKNKEIFREKNMREIMLFESAFEELKKAGFPKITEISKLYKKLEADKRKLYAEYKTAKSEFEKWDVVKKNVESILNLNIDGNKIKTRELSQ